MGNLLPEFGRNAVPATDHRWRAPQDVVGAIGFMGTASPVDTYSDDEPGTPDTAGSRQSSDPPTCEGSLSCWSRHFVDRRRIDGRLLSSYDGIRRIVAATRADAFVLERVVE